VLKERKSEWQSQRGCSTYKLSEEFICFTNHQVQISNFKVQNKMKQQICILGSTGSIGTQALDVIEQHSDLYEVYCLTANNRVKELAEQAHKFHPAAVVVANEAHYDELKNLLSDEPDIKVYAGAQALCDIVQAEPIDMVLASMVGFSGLEPTIHAIKARKKICLANKETLVVAGELICNLAQEYHVPILPVDSEHSAIFQSLVGEGDNEVEKLLLTCSGGPFRNFTHEQLEKVTAADALKHPTWDMGAKITIDSASLMNKGFEVTEAKWLFGVPAEKIEVLIHPQSIVHSAVQFADGAVKAQLGVPDMRLPIQYAFSFPQRLHLNGDRLDLFKAQDLQFFEPDYKKFKCLQLAFDAIKKGGNMSCIVNAANEIVNAGFRKGECGFLQMADIIEETMAKATFDSNPDLDVYLQTDAEARRIAAELMKVNG
jgi:1-deoxy-D-xylulose-5-phosphate reductoisomerase